MDKLKDFVNNNKEAFDSYTPSDELWSEITAALPSEYEIQPTQKKWLFSWRIAASVVMILGVGYVLGKYSSPIKKNKEIISLSPKYGKEVIKYASFIESKKAQISSYMAQNPGMVEEFSRDLKELDLNYEELKSELPNNPNQEEILNQMIENLQWQIEMLDQQIKVINTEKNTEEEGIVWSEDLPFEKNNDIPVHIV